MNKIKKRFLKATIILGVLSLLFFVLLGAGDYTRYAINDSAVTTTNDTLISPWIPLNGASNVSIFYGVDDSTYMKGTFEYRYGGLTSVSSVVGDTLSLDNRVGSTGLSKGKILQGYGLAASLIPGANAIRFTMIRQSQSGDATNDFKLAINYGE
jgi:hypothetical protein